MILFASKPLFNDAAPIVGWLKGTLVPKPGTADFAGQLPNGNHLAVNPAGNYEERPAGTFGTYETIRVRGTNLVVQYTDNGADVIHVIPFVADL